MEHPVLQCVLDSGAKLPSYQTPGSAGADLSARVSAPLVIQAGDFAPVPTGVRAEIPEGFEAQIRPRSGLAAKHGVTCLNSPGTIDSDYRGEILVLLVNLGKAPFVVNDGDRIAQMVIAPVARGEFTLGKTLSPTGRAEGGFGSTGL
ncbi:MAG: dUTP diphosphatase [Spirochaetaceae bacterium]|jgi:dUTP pyrophosphatase|nr:dUTP diphosphatase [Spirochaetaceae bacterium]